MKQKYILLIIIFLSSFISMSYAQSGILSVAEYLKITQSSLSSISQTLKTKEYSLQYTKDMEDRRYPKDLKDIGWGYNLKYSNYLDDWEIINKGKKFAYFKVLYARDKPYMAKYCFSQLSIYNDFLKKLPLMGFIKETEEIDVATNTIKIEFINERTGDMIWLKEDTEDSIPYSIDWTNWKNE